MTDISTGNNRSPGEPGLLGAIAAIEQNKQLDPALDGLYRVAGAPLEQGGVRRFLSGAWLGHTLHPMLTDLPIGLWTSAGVLDVLGGRSAHTASRRLIGLGLLSAPLTMAAGLSDWAALKDRGSQRVGFVHAVSNAAGTTAYLLSWRARRKGHHGRGVLLAAAGATALTAGGYLGGHLVYRQGAGVMPAGTEQQPPAVVPAA
jgi:uncharacterized membrane protein